MFLQTLLDILFDRPWELHLVWSSFALQCFYLWPILGFGSHCYFWGIEGGFSLLAPAKAFSLGGGGVCSQDVQMFRVVKCTDTTLIRPDKFTLFFPQLPTEALNADWEQLFFWGRGGGGVSHSHTPPHPPTPYGPDIIAFSVLDTNPKSISFQRNVPSNIAWSPVW